MADVQLTLTAEEHKFLKSLLENELKKTSVEEHRTRDLIYRKHVVHQEDLIRGVLGKLQAQPQLV